MQKGFSTIELLIACTISLIFLSGASQVIFGGQTALIDGRMTLSAILYTVTNHDSYKTVSRNDYVIASTSLYINPCSYIKNTRTQWDGDTNRDLIVSINEFIHEYAYEEKLAEETCDPTPPSLWNNPTLSTTYIPTISGTGTDMAFFTRDTKKYAVITTANTLPSREDIWILKIEPTHVTLVSQLNIGAGALGVVIKDEYAYVLHASSSEQLKIVHIKDPELLSTSSIVASVTLPNTTSSCAACLTPKSIAYFDGNIYIGLPYLANLGSIPSTRNNELHIICMQNSVRNCSPERPLWVGSFNVNHNVEDIVIGKNQHTPTQTIAYLATSASEARYPELTIYDVSEPDAITFIGSFSPSGNLYGTALFLIGNFLYMGRERATGENKDLYVLDITDPRNPNVIADQKLLLRSGTRVTDIVVQKDILFVATSDTTHPFFIFEINAAEKNITRKNICMGSDISTSVPSFTYAFNVIYALRAENPAQILTIYDHERSCKK